MRRARFPFAERIDALPVRERALLFVAALGAVYAAWDFVLFAPLDAKRETLVAQVEQLDAEIVRLNLQAKQVAAARVVDPDTDGRARLAAVREETDALRASIERVTHSLVPPRDMSRVLEALLTRETGLSLVRLEGLGSLPVLVEPSDGEAGAEGDDAAPAPPAGDAPLAVRGPTLFKHGLRIELEGGYLDTLRYLLALEELSWGFLWDSVRFEVDEYPTARVSITVYSLSLENGWIGV